MNIFMICVFAASIFDKMIDNAVDKSLRKTYGENAEEALYKIIAIGSVVLIVSCIVCFIVWRKVKRKKRLHNEK